MAVKSDPGREAEEKAVKAAELLLHTWPEVVGFHYSRSSQWGKEADAFGIDLILLLRSKLALPLQIKCSGKRVREHLKRHPYILVIVVDKNVTVEAVANQIKKLILRCYRRIKLPLSTEDLSPADNL